jgi:Kef-type K+ transport system membrane component KefB
MRVTRSLLFYALALVVFGFIIYWIIQQGHIQEATRPLAGIHPVASADSFDTFRVSLGKNVQHPLAVLLLQIIVIILCARFFGFLFKKIGQPAVIGEIVAGIILGPSVIGLFFPQFSQVVFPVSSLVNLQFLSQVGLILFMFVVGMELEVSALKKQAFGAFIISHISIIVPFALGVGLAWFLYQNYAPVNVSFLAFALFMGIAMSITAFPVLARILQEKGLTKSKLGSMALTSAAIGDITAWFILAAVIAIVKAGSSASVLYSLGMAAVYVAVMLIGIRPLLQWLSRIYDSKEHKRTPVIAIVFLILLVSAYITEIIGIHALFGAFFVGVLMPTSFNFRHIVTEKIEDVSVVLLLPLFFVFNGLRTQIGLLNEPSLWIVCAWVILMAIAGKFGGTAIAAKIVGQSWKDSLSLGVLMNTRGLMELIVLNIGYELGILSPEIFTIMVIMAILTTLVTGPVLDLINWLLPEKMVEKEELTRENSV